jgi:phage I-like protein
MPLDTVYSVQHRGHNRIGLTASVIGLVASDSDRAWIQIAVEGVWEGHPSGPFTFNRKVFRQIIGNFKQAANPLPLTYGHPNSETAALMGAAGWIHNLEARGNALWALVEFTDRAASMVRKGEHKWCSVVVGFDSTDRESGEEVGPELFEVGLVLSPFLDGMTPIELSRAAGAVTALAAEGTNMNDVELLKAAIKELGDDADLAKITRWVEAKKALAAVESGEGEEPAEGEEPPPEMAAGNEPDEPVELAAPVEAATDIGVEPAADDAATGDMAAAAMEALGAALGTDAAGAMAALEENMEAVVGVLQGAPASGGEADAAAAAGLARSGSETVAALSREVKTATAELAAARAELATDKLAHRLDLAERDGVIIPAQRDYCERLGKSDLALLEEHLTAAAKSPAVPRASLGRKPASTPAKDHPTDHPLYAGIADTFRGLSLARLRDPAALHIAVCEEITKRETRASN